MAQKPGSPNIWKNEWLDVFSSYMIRHQIWNDKRDDFFNILLNPERKEKDKSKSKKGNSQEQCRMEWCRLCSVFNTSKIEFADIAMSCYYQKQTRCSFTFGWSLNTSHGNVWLIWYSFSFFIVKMLNSISFYCQNIIAKWTYTVFVWSNDDVASMSWINFWHILSGSHANVRILTRKRRRKTEYPFSQLLPPKLFRINKNWKPFNLIYVQISSCGDKIISIYIISTLWIVIHWWKIKCDLKWRLI